MVKKTEEQPRAQRLGWLKNGNQPGDFTKAPRCGAKTRKGTLCQAPAMRNGRCRMHGGKSPGPPKGNQNALKHGHYTKEAIERGREMRILIAMSNELLKKIE